MVKPENEEKLQERVNRLSEENKERLIREYVRRKIAIMIREQAEETEEEPAEDTAEETPVEEPKEKKSKKNQPAVIQPAASADTIEMPAAEETPEIPAEEPAEEPSAEDTELEAGTEKDPAELYRERLLLAIQGHPEPTLILVPKLLNFMLKTIKKAYADSDSNINIQQLTQQMDIWETNNLEE